MSRRRSVQTRSGARTAIESILTPRSVVVIGASPHGRGFTSAPLKNLKRHGFGGRIYAVNPRHTDINGIRCYPDVASLPEVPDTAVVVVGARRVSQALTDCAAAGIGTATVVAGGFAELGSEGARLEAEIRAILRDAGLRLVGPNTAGLMNIADNYVPRAGLNHPDTLTRGGLAVVTQSGALCNTLRLRILARGQGLSYAVATGSQWDLDLWDFVDHYTLDERTRADFDHRRRAQRPGEVPRRRPPGGPRLKQARRPCSSPAGPSSAARPCRPTRARCPVRRTCRSH